MTRSAVGTIKKIGTWRQPDPPKREFVVVKINLLTGTVELTSGGLRTVEDAKDRVRYCNDEHGRNDRAYAWMIRWDFEQLEDKT